MDSLYLCSDPFTTPLPAQSIASGQALIQKKCGIQHVHLPLEKYGQNYPPLFNEIRVLDARADTARIGIVRNGNYSENEIRLHSAAANQLTGYLNAAYTRPAGGHALLIVLKKFWISTSAWQLSAMRPRFDVQFQVEAYERNPEGFMPILRMDTTEEAVKGQDVSIVGQREFRELLAELMDRLAAADLDRKSRLVSIDQIDSFNHRRFEYPMDAGVRLTRGAYLNFREFLNNAPSIPDARFTAEKGGYELRIPDENGQYYYTHKVWGYCDGNVAYIMMDGNLFPIYKVHHQFYVLGSKEYGEKTGIILPLFIPLGPAALIGFTDINPTVVRNLRIFRVSTETGLVTE